MTVKLLTEQHMEFLSLTKGCTGLSESTLVKMPHCWKSHAAAQIVCLSRAGVCVFANIYCSILLTSARRFMVYGSLKGLSLVFVCVKTFL